MTTKVLHVFLYRPTGWFQYWLVRTGLFEFWTDPFCFTMLRLMLFPLYFFSMAMREGKMEMRYYMVLQMEELDLFI